MDMLLVFIFIFFYALKIRAKAQYPRTVDTNQFEQLFTFSPLPSHTFLVI